MHEIKVQQKTNDHIERYPRTNPYISHQTKVATTTDHLSKPLIYLLNIKSRNSSGKLLHQPKLYKLVNYTVYMSLLKTQNCADVGLFSNQE